MFNQGVLNGGVGFDANKPGIIHLPDWRRRHSFIARLEEKTYIHCPTGGEDIHSLPDTQRNWTENRRVPDREECGLKEVMLRPELTTRDIASSLRMEKSAD